ncbi:MAG: DUF4265 domain-containing protein [Crocinitomicaceae bacterium]|nr:DUF4265 domain-containing protein [Crocinitomicaceae bacterium]
METSELVKVHINLPNHWAIQGEYLWATPLGNDLFRIENVPFYAYGLNFHDIVNVTYQSDPEIIEIKEIVKASGHRTFRIFFRSGIEQKEQERILSSMEELKISFERANEICFSLNMKPSGNYQAVFDRLDELENQNIIGFETCEARIKGSFDDVPDEN